MRQPSRPDICSDDIETLNAHGPYNHAVWRGPAGVLTHEEALSGRGQAIAAALRSELTRRYTRAQMRRMSILDVGCYDGWILHEISDLPFRRMLGVEPRAKNIRKGEVARRILGIETRVEFRQGGLESLDTVLAGDQFDIVIATGLLHHVESPAEALRHLRRCCRKLLFLETIALDSRHLRAAARAEIEPKDVVYYGRAKAAGLSGNKLESSYYDGSSTGLRVVNIPSFETIAMSCEAAGFQAPVLVMDPAEYRRRVWRGRRPFHAVICIAEPAAETASEPGLEHAREYERQLARTRIPFAHLDPLHQRYVRGQRRVADTELSRAVRGLISGRSIRKSDQAIARLAASESAREILRSIRHAPADKIALEMGKHWLSRGDLHRAEAELLAVTGRWNADWRSVYRAFHCLAAIARRRGDRSAERRYQDLLATANPHYPADAWPM